jgi:hypothetical protein
MLKPLLRAMSLRTSRMIYGSGYGHNRADGGTGQRSGREEWRGFLPTGARRHVGQCSVVATRRRARGCPFAPNAVTPTKPRPPRIDHCDRSEPVRQIDEVVPGHFSIQRSAHASYHAIGTATERNVAPTIAEAILATRHMDESSEGAWMQPSRGAAP